MPLFEKVKEIFKKYGFTVSAIVLAAWTVIGAVIRAITTSLKPLGKDIGKALQGVSKKTSFIAALWIGFEGWADWWVKTKGPLSMRRRPTVVSLCLRHWLTRASCSVLPA